MKRLNTMSAWIIIEKSINLIQTQVFILTSLPFREVSEWFKEHAWKACIRQRIGGSNPFLSAK